MSMSERVAEEQMRDLKGLSGRAVSLAEQLIRELIHEAKQRNLQAQIGKTEAMKNNENQMTGITIRFEGDQAASTQYLAQYESRIRDGESIRDIAKEMMDIAVRAREDGLSIRMPDINLAEAAKSLNLKVMNKETNPGIAASCPHIDMGNGLMAVPYWKISMNNDNLASFLVKREISEGMLHMTDQELLSMARKNTIEPGYSIRGMTEVLQQMMGDQVPSEIVESMVPEGQEKMYVVTSNEDGGIFGPTALLDPYTMDAIAEKIGENNYYILPSSIFEILVIPESEAPSPEELQAMVVDVNRTTVSAQYKLSDDVFRFDGNTQKLSVCNTTEQLREQREIAQSIGETISNTHKVKM